MLGDVAVDEVGIMLLFVVLVVCGVMIGPVVNPWILFGFQGVLDIVPQ